jgi:hypothetical protein
MTGDTLVLDSTGATLRIFHGRPLAEAIERLAHGVLDDDAQLPAALLEVLREHGIVAALPAYPETGKHFLDSFFAMCNAWVEDVFASPFWHDFLAGHSSPAQVWCFLAQLLHRTAGADVHNRIAAERCSDPTIAPLLKRHYDEERGHALLLADGFKQYVSAGVACVTSDPLRSTQALINFMIDISADPIAYLGCYGIFHAPSTIRSESDLVEQFAGYTRMYPYAAQAFMAVARHAAVDYKLGHDRIALEEWVLGAGRPAAYRVAATARGARGAAQAFRSIFDECARAV